MKNIFRKKVPNELIRYIESLYDMQVVYKKDVKCPKNTLSKVTNNYLHENGFWRITEEVKEVKPISEDSVKETKNLFILRLYYGEYGETYCYGLAGFIKRGKRWQYFGKNGKYTLKRLPSLEELFLNFTDESGNHRHERCQGMKDFYYKY